MGGRFEQAAALGEGSHPEGFPRPVSTGTRARLLGATLWYAARAMQRATRLLIAGVLGAIALGSADVVSAERSTLGPHFGVNFDNDDPFLGLEGRFDLGTVGSSAIIQLNPSFSFYFTDGPWDLFNFSLNVPFEFLLEGSVVRPFAAPGLAIWHVNNGDSHTDLALNLIGGVLFALDPVEPFVQLRISIGDGSSAELMGGVLFRL